MKIPYLSKKSKYIEINCYTNSRVAYDLFKPKRYSKYLPEWYKECPIKQHGDAKSCYGILSLMKLSISIPSWTDFYCSTTVGNKKFTPADNATLVDYHSGDFASHMDTNTSASIIKIISPWMLEEASGQQFMLSNNPLVVAGFTIPSGIINFKYQHGLNFFVTVLDNTGEFLLNAGVPYWTLTPLNTEKELIINAEYNPSKASELHE